MSLVLYAHPFSSYCQKVLIALYENATPFEWRVVGMPEVDAELEALWSFKRFPVLVDDGRAVRESSIIIEHLALHHPGPVLLLPDDPFVCLDVRFMDRFFDNYVMTPQGKFVYDALRPAERRDPYGVEDARRLLDHAYRWLDIHLRDREWAAGDTFTMADCAAAPSLFYADWTYPIADEFAALKAYRQRLLARPSFARAVDEARPFRHYFPLGAPARD